MKTLEEKIETAKTLLSAVHFLYLHVGEQDFYVHTPFCVYNTSMRHVAQHC